MNTLEDRIRSAVAQTAAEITPGSIPSLSLAGRGQRRRPGPAGTDRTRGRWLGVLIPLAAAASVIALAVGALVAGGVITTGRSRVNHANRGAAARAYPPPTVDGLPAYFLAVPLSLNGHPVPPALRPELHRRTAAVRQTLDIVVTATGRVAATASLPGTVSAVAATGTGTFYAAMTSGSATGFYQIRPPASGHVATVVRLPIPALPSVPMGHSERSPVAYLAASPDGGRLAISTVTSHGQSTDIQGLIVASTTTGREHVWTTPEPDINGSIGPMAWLADGRTLAFNWLGFESPTPASLRLLDTTAPGSDLLASRAAAPLNRSEFSDLTISPDGLILIGIADHPRSPAVVQGRTIPLGSAIEFSVRTGRASVLYQTGAPGSAVAGSCNDPLWMSSTGQEVLLACTRPLLPGPADAVVTRVMVLAHGRLIRQLPWWSDLANEQVALGS
jgi:hypothetical protein